MLGGIVISVYCRISENKQRYDIIRDIFISYHI